MKYIILFFVFALATLFVSTFAAFVPSVVPQSSTAGLGFIFIVPLTIIGGFIGVLLGRYVKSSKGLIKLLLLVIILVVISIIAILFNPKRRESENANQFGLKADTGVVEKIDLKNENPFTVGRVLDCDVYLPLDFENAVIKSLTWGGNDVEVFLNSDSGYSIRNKSTGETIVNSLKNLPYIRSLSLLSYEKAGASYLFVVANLRATSERSMLAVYKYPNEIIYEELLYRRYGEMIVSRGETASKEETIILSEYSGGYGTNSDYNLCKVERIEQKDFSLQDYGYKIK